jgi:LCP family protein required for cell wall assembly
MTYSGTTAVGLERLKEMPIILNVSHLMSSPDRQLAGEAEDRINILLLGMGGEGHDGANLTDTIIVASIRPSDHQVAMLSVPRDLLVPVPDAGWRKINSANAFGEVKNKGRGGETSRAVMESLLGISLPYYVRIDFNGFKEIIDSVDGVDVYVERTFKDYTYPTENYKIQTVSFAKGWQHMDGETALRFARSRHGTNGEGSDFARSARQQKVIMALREKVLSGDMLKNPASIANALAALRSNITTNLQIGEILRLAKIGQDVDKAAIKHKVLDDGAKSPLVSSNYGGAYVLMPRGNDWGAIREVAVNLFETAQANTADEAEPKPADLGSATKTTKDTTAASGNKQAAQPDETTAAARVEIRNGTGVAGGARTVSQAVSKAGFTVAKIGNADSFDYTTTTVYDLTGGKRKIELTKLKEVASATRTVRGQPKGGASSDLDFVVIIGKN